MNDKDTIQAQLEQMQQEIARLRATEQELLALIENTDDFVLFSDENALPRIFNTNYARAMKELMGVDMRPGLQPHSLLEEPDRSYWDSLHQRVLGGEKFKAEYAYDHQGETRHFEVSFNPIFDGGRVIGFSEYTRDITDHKRVEEQLRADREKSQDDYRELFETMLDGFAIHEMILDDAGQPIDYRFLAVNPAFETQTGLSAKNIVGRTVREVIPGIESSWIERYGRVALTGVPARFESYTKDLDRHYEVDTFRPQAGQFACVFQDVTDRRRLEEEQARAERLRSVGILAGGIAHDFNNILASLVTSIQAARASLDDNSEAARMLGESEKACARAGGLTKQLLTFARGGQPVTKTIELAGRLEEWTNFALRGSNVSAAWEIADDLWLVEADEGQLSQVIHNVVQNANQSMPDGGTIQVTASNRVITDTTQVEPGRYVEIRIADCGVGIPKEVLSRVFDPYFTTKEFGSGLGLTTCYSIVKYHGGTIRAESAVGKGTKIQLLLPASESTAVEENARAGGVKDGSGVRILLMDDDEQLRALGIAILERFNYQGDAVPHGAAALSAYQTALDNGRPYAVVVLDLTVPGGMGGAETMARLKKIDPQVRALVSSGYSDDPIMANFRDYGFAGVVAKPYRVEELARAIDEARSQ